MATLQKLRNAGPLLLIFVGIALFAFIAGDALRIFQSPQGAQAVGSINGEEVSAAEFQELYEEYSTVMQYVRGGAPMSDAEHNQLKDQVWGEYLQNKIITEEAAKIGLTVSDAEILAIVSEGKLPILQQTPFRNTQGQFDIDILNGFLADYDKNKDNFEYVQQMKPTYDYWRFIEKTIKMNLLTEKYQALITNSFISNPVVAENSFNASNVTYNAEIKAFPYTAIADSTVNVSDKELKAAYESEKQLYKEREQSRDIKYVSVTVVPSKSDHDALRNELAEQVNTLAQENDYAAIVRAAGSEFSYSELAWAKTSFPEEVRLRLDSVKVNEVVGPIYNPSDNSYTVFKSLGKTTVADSVLYRVLPVNDAALADSLLNVLKNGGDFKEIAAKYVNDKTDSLWLTSAMYEGAPTQGDDATFISTLLNSKKGEYNTLSFSNGANIIYQVIATKNPVEKYNAAVIKRTVEFSSETYADAYNKFSQYVASCKNIEDLEKNVENYDGYRVLTQNRLFNTSHNIAQISDTRKAIRWIFSEANIGDVSPLYECGDNNTLLVVALAGVNEKGFTSMDKLSFIVRAKAIKDKKADKIMNDIKGKNFDELTNVAGVKSDVAERISFASPTFVKSISANEPAISSIVTKMQPGEVSAPIKGDKGVYVIKLLSVNKGGREFNPESEQETLKSIGRRNAGMFFNDLYEKANVEDNRYLYF